jgi:ATP-dependent RNA helicase RhlE
MTVKSSGIGFTGLGIAPGLLDAIARLRFTEPTPIQKRSIPIGLEGKDLIAIAQTGTGKTLAFGVPMIQRLAQVKGRGLILLPTRELAIQVDEALHAVGRASGLRTAVLIGGASMALQLQALERKPRVIIATPGRLLDHLEQRTVILSDIRILVLDEADRMLDMGFAPQINRILASVPRERQTMLFSASIPQEIVAIAQRHMRLPIQVEIAPSGTAAEKVTQEVFFVDREAKTRLLEVLLKEYHGPVLIFTRTKHGAHNLAHKLKARGQSAADIHSNLSLPQRRKALEGFKSGKYRVLVATDIAARGIDVIGIELVVNYDLPSNSQDYVHRIGRTGRAGRAGRAVSFATFDQRGEVKNIERLIRAALPVTALPSLPPERLQFHQQRRPQLPRHPRSSLRRSHHGRHSRRYEI